MEFNPSKGEELQSEYLIPREHAMDALRTMRRLSDSAGPLAEASWAKQRVGRATQSLPNGFCGPPVQKSCPHANACLTCPMFVTTAEFLPQHREQRRQTVQLLTAAEARGQARLIEMNRTVLGNLDRIITSLDSPEPAEETG